MIESIEIKNKIPFSNQKLNDLKRVNYIYGANGSGKTTLSRLVERENQDQNSEDECTISWQGTKKLETRVFNTDFVKANFQQHEGPKGIVTIGESDISTQKRIEELTDSKNKLQNEIGALEIKLNGNPDDTQESSGKKSGGKTGELKRLLKNIKTDCWKLHPEKGSELYNGFNRYHDRKEKFLTKLINVYRTNIPLTKAKDELIKDEKILFNDEANELSPINQIECNALFKIHSNPIWDQSIVGIGNSNLSSVINELKNSDWVQHGQKYINKNSDPHCPFCQQSLPENFLENLELHFDKKYQESIDKINDLKNEFSLKKKKLFNSLISDFEAYRALEDHNLTSLENKIRELKQTFKIIEKQIEQKIQNPSQLIQLEPFENRISEMKKTISKINDKIQQHNTLITNRKTKRQEFQDDCFRLLACVELKDKIETYLQSKEELDGKIEEIRGQVNLHEAEIENIKAEILELNKQIGSTEDSCNEINRFLENAGFTCFKLKTSDDKKHYQIIRPGLNDQFVNETLSEGEKTFLTFLYFYMSLRNVNSQNKQLDDIVVFIDDPVSSLDHQCVFFVKELINKLSPKKKEEEKGPWSHIKQVFVSTHNAFFHREVSREFNKHNSGEKNNKNKGYWTLTKRENATSICHHESNPISTTYDLLWKEIKDHKESENSTHQTSICIQNTMRRILETYLGMPGNEIRWSNKLIEKTNPTQAIARDALLSWGNHGSHKSFSDLDEIHIQLPTVQTFLNVFEQIFKDIGQHGHYQWMMGIEASNENE